MKNCIFLALILGLLLNPILSAEQQETKSIITFFVSHQSQQNDDYVEITLQIEAKDSSLTTAIQSAASTVEKISNLAKDYCNENAKKKADCKEVVEVGKFNVQPRYQTIRKQPVFMGFTVTHEMTLAIRAVQNIGTLVDQILTKSGITLQKFQWKPFQQPKTQLQAIEQGKEQGESLCEKMNKSFGRIVSIEELKGGEEEEEEEGEQGEEEGEEEEQEEEEGDETAQFKFVVECEEITKKKQSKDE